MNAAEAEQIARLLEHYQDLFLFAAAAQEPNNSAVPVGELAAQLATGNFYGGIVFGYMALVFVYTYEAVAKELNFPASIVGEVDLGRLNIVQNTIDPPDGGSAQVACLRHLRNCFAHGRFIYAVNGTQTTVTMRDFNRAGIRTFEAACEAQVIFEIAERLLIAARKETTAIALPQTHSSSVPPATGSPPGAATP